MQYILYAYICNIYCIYIYMYIYIRYNIQHTIYIINKFIYIYKFQKHRVSVVLLSKLSLI